MTERNKKPSQKDIQAHKKAVNELTEDENKLLKKLASGGEWESASDFIEDYNAAPKELRDAINHYVAEVVKARIEKPPTA